jgi:hypothetical protein
MNGRHGEQSERSGLVRWWSFWLCVIVVAIVLNIQSNPSKILANSLKIPLVVNPSLFIGALLLVVVVAISTTVVAAIRDAKWIWMAGIPGILLGCGLLLVSLSRGQGSLNARDEVQAINPPNPDNLFATAVFFSNRSPFLTSEAKQEIGRLIEVFRTCGSGGLFVRGFASSAQFHVPGADTDILNMGLANARAEQAAAQIDQLLGPHAATIKFWSAPQLMTGARRIRDIDAGGKRLLTKEALNRRVEVYWRSQNCMNTSELPVNTQIAGLTIFPLSASGDPTN